MIIHTSDLHIGAFTGRSLFNASIDAFEEIASYAIDKSAEAVVVSGDFFERPRLENYRALQRVVSILNRLRNAGIPVITVPGSHDSSPRGQDLLRILEAAGLIHVTPYEISGDTLVLEPLEIGDYVFYGIPGLRNSREVYFLESGRIMFRGLRRDRVNILLAHTSVEFQGYRFSDFSYRYGRAIVARESVLKSVPGEISYIALGHIHFPIPLDDSFIGNIAYPGAPIGRDLSDLRETWILRNRYGRKRRFLEVVLGETKPLVKSIWRDFGVEVDYLETEYYPNINEIVSVIKSRVKDLGGRYRVLLVTIHNIPPEKKGEILAKIRTIEGRFNATIHLTAKAPASQDPNVILSTYEATDNIEEIERTAVEEAVKKLGLGIDPEKILKLISILGEERPPEEKKDEYYTRLFKDVKPVLEEILGGGQQHG